MSWPRRLFKHALLFVSAKSAVLLGPLVAASVLTSDQYGTLEWWLAATLALGSLAACGANGIVAYGTLGGPASKFVSTAGLGVSFISSAFICVAIVGLFFGLGEGKWAVGPIAALSAVVPLQLIASARLKALGFGAWASLAESGVYIAVLVSVILTSRGFNMRHSLVICEILVAGGLLLVVTRIFDLPRRSSWLKQDYWRYFGTGIKFMVGGVAATLFMALPRLALGLIDTVSAVAAFSLAFRWLSIAIVMHQFLNTLFFKELYGVSPSGRRDKWLSLIVVSVSLLAAAIVILTWLPLTSLSRFGVALPVNMQLNLLMAAAVVLWSLTACLEGCLFRINKVLSQSAAAGVGVGTILMISLSFWLTNKVSDVGMALVWITGFGSLIAIQSIALWRADERMPLLTGSGVLASISFVAAAFLI